jgi:hypothetical protein
MRNKKGQIWIETVLYTLIGIALIGVVLAFVMPKINEQKDKLIIEQTIDALDAVDQKVNTVLQAPGNVREINFAMKRGEFHVNSTDDTLYFIIPGLKKPYSEPDTDIQVGRITLRTETKQGDYDVVVKVNYLENITYNLDDINKKFDPASVPYRFTVANEGVIDPTNGKNVVNIKEVSA